VYWSIDQPTRVATITLNNPLKLNALTVELGDEFTRVVEELKEEVEAVGAVVLTGSGDAFSAGGDLGWLADRHTDTPSRNAAIMRAFYDRFLCLRSLPIPVIAAINGPAIGAGLCIALACDYRVAAKQAKMGVTFVRVGIHPGMATTHFLPALVGPQIAARLILTGDVVSSDEGLALGLVGSVHESPEATVSAARDLAARMASAAPLAVRSAVRTLRMGQDEGLDRALWREADAQSQCYASTDLLAGLTGLKTRRPPEFRQHERYGHRR
jgi:enoyl-CoA hydratase/carnithine racemase